LRILLAVWFFAHGLAHVPGFIVAWQLRSFPSLPFHTTVLANRIDIGRLGIRAVGLAWLLGAVAFVALGFAASLRIPWWRETAYVALGLSLVLCVLGWPHSKIGVASNIAVAVLLFVGTRLGWV